MSLILSDIYLIKTSIASYEAFNVRINRLSEALRILSEILLSENCPPDRDLNTSVIVMDSLPNNYLFGKTYSFYSQRDNK